MPNLSMRLSAASQEINVSDISNANTLTLLYRYSVATLKNDPDPDNLNPGYVHSGYYQGKEDDEVFTDPVL